VRPFIIKFKAPPLVSNKRLANMGQYESVELGTKTFSGM
jgi:hypothetical protein